MLATDSRRDLHDGRAPNKVTPYSTSNVCHTCIRAHDTGPNLNSTTAFDHRAIQQQQPNLRLVVLKKITPALRQSKPSSTTTIARRSANNATATATKRTRITATTIMMCCFFVLFALVSIVTAGVDKCEFVASDGSRYDISPLYVSTRCVVARACRATRLCCDVVLSFLHASRSQNSLAVACVRAFEPRRQRSFWNDKVDTSEARVDPAAQTSATLLQRTRFVCRADSFFF